MLRIWDAEDIHARLAAMRAADPGFEVFGARSHGHRLEVVLSEACIAAFEARHGVRLPEEYRSFLLEVGDGGAGPYYGLYRLDGSGMYPFGLEERNLPGHLAAPFPHTEAWNPPYAPNGTDPVPAGLLTEDEYDDVRWTAGSLVIAHFGCGAFYRLVVTGPARGQIWLDDCGSSGGLFPEAPSFRDWYMAWLDRASNEITHIRRS